MKKLCITFYVTFYGAFSGFGQSVTITPTPFDQVSIRAIGDSISPYFSGFRGKGSSSTPTPVNLDDIITGIGGFGYNGTGFTDDKEENTSIRFRANQKFTATANGTHIQFLTTANDSTSLNERMRISHNGNVGIGTTTPNAPLQLGNSFANRKIVLRDLTNNNHQFFGWGTTANALRYQVGGTTDSHVFLAGTSPTTSNELMRIQGNGNVGIGTTTFSTGEKFSITNGNTKFGVFPGYLDNAVNADWTTLDMPGTKGLRVWDNFSVDGNVGIGTPAPAYKLQVTTPTASYGITHTDGTVTIGTYVSNTGGWIGTRSNHPFSIYTNDGSPALNANADRRVAINGVATTEGRLQIRQVGEENSITMFHSSNQIRWGLRVRNIDGNTYSGNLQILANGSVVGVFDYTNGGYAAISDRRLKKNIAPLEDVLPKVMLLKPSTYQYVKNNPNGRVNTGFIAQEVEALFPSFVPTTTDQEGKDLKTMDYAGMSVVAIKAIQEQQVIIMELETLIKNLQKENATLKNENKTFESRLGSLEKLLLLNKQVGN
jgi:hypothetical protein